MKRRIISNKLSRLILWCLVSLSATPLFATVEIESVVCNNTTGDITVTFKNNGQGTRTNIKLYSNIKLEAGDEWEYWNIRDWKDMGPGEEGTRHIGTPDQIVYRRQVAIYDDPLNPNDPQPRETNSCDDLDPRWKLLLWQLDGNYPMSYSGAPGQVVHVQFGAEYINQNNAGGNLAASCSVVDDKGVKGNVTINPNWVALGTWGLVQVDIQIPNNAPNGWSDSVTLTVGDPISLTKSVTCMTGVPTVSEWGLIVMGLLLLTVGTIFIRKRRIVLASAGGPVAIFLLLSATYVSAEQPTLSIGTTIDDTTTAPTLIPETRDTAAGRNIVAAAAFVANFGYYSESTNILAWLDEHKIFSKENLGALGECNPATGEITIDSATLIPPGINHTLDMNYPNDFYWLLHLASVLIHEKVHAHQTWAYMYGSNFKEYFGFLGFRSRTNPAEQDAYSEELAFIDSLIADLKARIRAALIEEPLDVLIALFKELRDALGYKASVINGYYSEHPNYGPIPYTTNDAVELGQLQKQVSTNLTLLEGGYPVDTNLYGQVESGLDDFMARINPQVEQWLAGAPQRSADAEGAVESIGTIASISATVGRSRECAPGDWFSNYRLASDLFAIQGNPVQFDSPVVLIMPFNPDVISDVNKVNIYSYDRAQGSWGKLANGRLLDPNAHTISANINGFPVLGSELAGFQESSSGIPTVSEWGLMVMGLLLLTVGTIFIRKYQAALVPAGGTIPVVCASGPLFAASVFFKVVAGAITLALLGIAAVIWQSGRISAADLAGTILCAGIVAYWVHLLLMWRNSSRGGGE